MAELIIDTDKPGWDSALSFGACGTVPRNYEITPMRAVNMPLIPRSEWSDRIKEQVATKSRLSDVRNTGNAGQPIPSLDQNPWGYCWAHSTTHAVMILRAKDNQPYVPLSAFAVAATIKNGRDEGGWGAQSLEFATQRGIPDQKFWPQKDASLSHGTAECWANAALHKPTEAWVDVSAPQWDRDLSFDQVATCLLTGVPVVGDFNWWGHSVCLLDLVEPTPGSFGVRIWNSWGDGWGEKGLAVVTGSKAIPDGATAPRVVTAAA